MTAPTAIPVRAVAPTGFLAEARVDGAAIVYRLYDVGFEIDLSRAAALLALSAPERVRPVRGEAQAIQIANPPVTVVLGTERVTVPGALGEGRPKYRRAFSTSGWSPCGCRSRRRRD